MKQFTGCVFCVAESLFVPLWKTLLALKVFVLHDQEHSLQNIKTLKSIHSISNEYCYSIKTHKQSVCFSNTSFNTNRSAGVMFGVLQQVTECMHSCNQCCQVRLFKQLWACFSVKLLTNIVSCMLRFWAHFLSVVAYLGSSCYLYELLLFVPKLCPIKQNTVVCPVLGSVHNPVPLVTVPDLAPPRPSFFWFGLSYSELKKKVRRVYRLTPIDYGLQYIVDGCLCNAKINSYIYCDQVASLLHIVVGKVASFGLVYTDLVACFSRKIRQN